MEQIRIEGEISRTVADVQPLVHHWSEKIMDLMDGGVFRDPELEKEYQEWRKARARKQ